jgi:hypothetical protein
MPESASTKHPEDLGFLAKALSAIPEELKAAIAGCGLTLLAALVAVQSGFAARSLSFMSSRVDTEVVLFLVPALAIFMAMFFLAARLAWRGSVPEFRRNRRRRLRWDGGRAN